MWLDLWLPNEQPRPQADIDHKIRVVIQQSQVRNIDELKQPLLYESVHHGQYSGVAKCWTLWTTRWQIWRVVSPVFETRPGVEYFYRIKLKIR